MMAATEFAYDDHGKLRLMARAENYVMVRRPHCLPFVMDAHKWRELVEKHNAEYASEDSAKDEK